ncbi:hATC-domain-containing protein [Trametes versicolor FP-101664 SS1]|uniref:hATC-domain-containing protein n=1 Tax=Trametes versicolor (strain FP-101664) TaxID=717944 RepID=UPI00046213E7|nr:hATC-domain-containing protein [Trametes versicolor FP-101664 SS1]EIW56574.1 hATC-domain-containing protein [Trametes versicolor FP-101664 SS1]
MFDYLPSLTAAGSNQAEDELTRYLAAPPEPVKDALSWWTERAHLYPTLARMALDYLSIPATSVDVERTFSRGRLLLSHVRNRLSAQSTRAVMCLGDWVRWDLVRTHDIRAVANFAEVEEGQGVGDDYEMTTGWDRIGAVLEST